MVSLEVSIYEKKETESREQMLLELRRVIQDHFPDLCENYTEPDIARLEKDYRPLHNMVIEDLGLNPSNIHQRAQTRMDMKSPGYLAAVSIRFIDDFIDTVIWPRLNEGNAEAMRGKVENFLRDALLICRKYDPQMPDEIIKLPLLELDFYTHTDQDFFNSHITDYLECKSFDLAYMRRRVLEGKGANDDPKPSRNLENMLDDLAKEFEFYREDPDFNLKKHIIANNLDNKKLIADFLFGKIGQLEGRYCINLGTRIMLENRVNAILSFL